jgi:uncharacterized protein (TIGR02246 family)
MNKIALFSLGLTLVVSSPALVAQDSGPANDVRAIRALEQRYITAFNAKDVKTIMTCFVPDQSLLVFDLVPPREYRGAAAFTKDWQDFLAAFPGPIQVQMTDLSVTADGKVGFGHRIDHVALNDKDGKTTHLVVRVTHGYRKMDGKWLIVHEHASVPVDMALSKPVFESQ